MASNFRLSLPGPPRRPRSGSSSSLHLARSGGRSSIGGASGSVSGTSVHSDDDGGAAAGPSSAGTSSSAGSRGRRKSSFGFSGFTPIRSADVAGIDKPASLPDTESAPAPAPAPVFAEEHPARLSLSSLPIDLQRGASPSPFLPGVLAASEDPDLRGSRIDPTAAWAADQGLHGYGYAGTDRPFDEHELAARQRAAGAPDSPVSVSPTASRDVKGRGSRANSDTTLSPLLSPQAVARQPRVQFADEACIEVFDPEDGESDTLLTAVFEPPEGKEAGYIFTSIAVLVVLTIAAGLTTIFDWVL